MVLRAVLAEDNLLVRQGVTTLLATSDVEVVAACADADELFALVDRHEPDVVITDIRMPPTHTDEGIRAAAELRRRRPELGVLVLSHYLEPTYAIDLLAAGSRGRGYLLKEHVDDIDRLVEAVRSVAMGGSYIDDDVVDALVRGRARNLGARLAGLSGREAEVLAELATGRNNAAIARQLGISEHAIEKHTSAIFAKLGLSDDGDINRRVSAVVMYLGGETPS